MTLKQCSMDHLEVRGPHLIVSGTVKLRRAKMPPFVEQIWRRAIAHAELRCRPHFFTVRSMQGAGGIYTSGAVVVGLEDLHELADRLIHAGGFRVLTDAEVRWYERFDPEKLITHKDRLRAAAEHLIHHELGHALAHQWGRSLEGPAEEAQADAIAGQFAAQFGSRTDLGQAFFRTIGCASAPHCSHPSADDRVHAFCRGYNAELERQATASW